MSKVGGFLILDSKDTAIGDEAEIGPRPCPQNAPRQKLADISNLPQKHRGLVQEDKAQCIPGTAKEYIEQLQKDNMVLAKVLAEKNKIIAQRGTELERLRANLIKIQEQNRQLALSHTQMLTDLNTGKDQLKALQHQLGCKSGLLKSSKLELEENVGTGQCKHADVEMNSVKLQEEGEFRKETRDDNEKPNNAKRRLRSSSFGSSESIQSDVNAGNKRPLTRRQSARFKSFESKPALDPNMTDDAKFSEGPMASDSDPQNGSASVNVVKNEHNNDVSISSLRRESQELGRSSLCRPSRQAAKKVQSYKEIPLNVKMRRSE